jgi:transposase
MEIASDALPDDLESLRAMVLGLQRKLAQSDQIAADLVVERDALSADVARLAELNTRLAELNIRLEHYLARLRRLSFGKSSERMDPDQLQLALEDTEQAIGEILAAKDKLDRKAGRPTTKRPAGDRASLPDHLPQIDVVIEPASTACGCCGGAMHTIGEDVSKRLDVLPVQYRVIATHRPKYACRGCEGEVVQAPAPARLIEGGLPTEALVADVIVAKYADHKPLYRQSQALARQGIVIDRSTLAFWVGYAAAELRPVWSLIRARLLASSRLFVDETTAPVLDPGRGRTKIGYFWAIARDDRPFGGSDPPAVAYTYAPGRGAEHASALLKDFNGVLQTDGYSAYKRLAKDRPNAITLAHCWSHVRRRFYDLAKGGSAPIATQAIARIGELYAIEAEIRGQSPDLRRAQRQAKSRPLVDQLEGWLMEQLKAVPGKSPMAETLRYALSRWDGLARFLDDGHLELDTNTVERAMRPIALNRKNALFAGGDEGGEHWAILATLIECCKLAAVEPGAYLTDILTRLVGGHLQSRLDELTPWGWKAAYAGA